MKQPAPHVQSEASLERVSVTTETPENRTPETVSLPEVRTGDRAVLRTHDLDHDASSLLDAMGLSIGTSFTVCRGGRSCVVRVGATRIAIASEVARRIDVERVA